MAASALAVTYPENVNQLRFAWDVLPCRIFPTYENNYLITIGIFLLVLLTSCRSDQTVPTVIQETTTRPVVTEVLSDIIDTCKFIPLETASDKSLVGHISKILKYKDKFYIATDNKRILVFNTDGSFSHRIDRLGRGPQEYADLADFDIADDRIIVLSITRSSSIHWTAPM